MVLRGRWIEKNISKQFFSSSVYLRSHSNDQDFNVPTEIRITAAEVVPLAGRSEHPQTGLARVHTSSLFLRISSHQNFFSFLNTQALVLLDKSPGRCFYFLINGKWRALFCLVFAPLHDYITTIICQSPEAHYIYLTKSSTCDWETYSKWFYFAISAAYYSSLIC